MMHQNLAALCQLTAKSILLCWAQAGEEDTVK